MTRWLILSARVWATTCFLGCSFALAALTGIAAKGFIKLKPTIIYSAPILTAARVTTVVMTLALMLSAMLTLVPDPPSDDG